MFTADEVGRSLRGAAALLGRRAEGLRDFETASEAAFLRSFAAILIASPAFVVSLALRRQELGLLVPGGTLFDAPGLALATAGLQVAAFLALPLAMIPIARRFGLGARYAPFVLVLNWIGAFAALALAVPGTLLLVGWATPELAVLFWLTFGFLALQAKWFATRATLGIGGPAAAGLTLLGLGLSTGLDFLGRLLF